MHAAFRPLCLSLLLAATYAGDAHLAFFNQKVSARTISLNQSVRIEMTTTPKVVEGVNIDASISDAVTMGSTAHWRLVGRPTVVLDERTKTVRVTVTLLPRITGDMPLPTLPVSWLNGDQVAEFGQVKVEAQLLVGHDIRPLPAEMEGVGGFAWGSTLAEVKGRLPNGAVSVDGERTLVKAPAGLELGFRRGQLVEATLEVGDMTLDTARASLLARWGSSQIDDPSGLIWILGWTRIASTAGSDGKSLRLALTREDLIAAATKAKVSEKVFSVLDAGLNNPVQPNTGNKPPIAP